MNLEQRIKKILVEYEKPKRKALSLILPILKTPIIFSKRTFFNFKNLVNFNLARHKTKDRLPCVIARHQSVIMRKLGGVDQRLQKQKVTNLKMAVKKINNIIIKPGEVFSFWYLVGLPKRSRGYVDGMLLSNGKVIEGVGGGLCQLSNLLYWLFLHAPIKVVERHHHSMDVFPDSGRILPFGSGATVFYNYVDLKIKNISSQTLQLNLWLTDTLLKGQILSDKKSEYKYSILEKDHYFVKYKDKYFRYNKIFRTIKKDGILIGEEEIMENFAPVLYNVDQDVMRVKGYKFLDL